MLAEWTAECSADAPTLVVPWSDPQGSARYIDLRAEPYDIAEIPEAEQYPALGRVLRALNATRSPVLTAKCDVWLLSPVEQQDEPDDPSELEMLIAELDIEPDEARAGIASYIDILWRDRPLFASAHQQGELLDRLTRRAERLDHPYAALACVMRPAMFDFDSSTVEGFAVTLYVRAVGIDTATALNHWTAALEDIATLLRGRDLALSRSSATIDTSAYPLRVRNMNE
jgi:hypothetical protein